MSAPTSWPRLADWVRKTNCPKEAGHLLLTQPKRPTEVRSKLQPASLIFTSKLDAARFCEKIKQAACLLELSLRSH